MIANYYILYIPLCIIYAPYTFHFVHLWRPFISPPETRTLVWKEREFPYNKTTFVEYNQSIMPCSDLVQTYRDVPVVMGAGNP